MNKEVKKTNFDMSTLNLQELITVYESIVEFVTFLSEKKIVQENKESK